MKFLSQVILERITPSDSLWIIKESDGVILIETNPRLLLVGRIVLRKRKDYVEVVTSSAKHGYGPLLYEAAMKRIYPLWLAPDQTSSISDAAQNLWKKFYERSDIEKKAIQSKWSGVLAHAYRGQFLFDIRNESEFVERYKEQLPKSIDFGIATVIPDGTPKVPGVEEMKSLQRILEEEIYPVGTRRKWNNGEFIKVAPGEWHPVSAYVKPLSKEHAEKFVSDPEGAWKASRAPLPIAEWIEKVEGLPADTSQHHKVDGIYKRERKSLHKRIIQGYMKQAKSIPEGEQPVALVMMGVTASGKSTARSKIALPEFEKNGVVMVDPDAIKEALPEYRIGIENRAKNSAPMVHEESSEIADQIQDQALSERKNVILDGTGKSLGNMQKKIKMLKEQGYKVSLLMPHVDVETALKRAYSRAENTGRAVPEEVVRGADSKISPNFLKLFKQADEANLISNEGKEPKFLMSYKAGQKPEIHDPEGMEGFLSYAKQRGSSGSLEEAIMEAKKKEKEQKGKSKIDQGILTLAQEIKRAEEEQMEGDGRKRTKSQQIPWPLND